MTIGKFIALEGGEGTGKSTQAAMLVDALTKRGLSVVRTREPGGTPGAEAIRELLLHPPGEGWNARAEALLFAAARSTHVETLIRPALAGGKWVVSDRFVDSSRAYQGGAGGLGDNAIMEMHSLGSDGFRPDVSLLFEIPPEVAADRIAVRDGSASDAIGGRDAAYHRTVADSFRAMAEAEPGGFVIIDGDGAPEEVHRRVMLAIKPFLHGAE